MKISVLTFQAGVRDFLSVIQKLLSHSHANEIIFHVVIFGSSVLEVNEATRPYCYTRIYDLFKLFNMNN